MLGLRRGTYSAQPAMTEADVAACQRLRGLAFKDSDQPDIDPFDPICTHVMVEEVKTRTLVACFRILPLTDGSEIARSYSAQFYNLSALEAFDGKMVEMGRFCIHPAHKDPDILRVAWGAMTNYVDDEGVEMLFGCSSFHGVEAEAYLDAFALLKERHLGPKRWLPQVKAPAIFPFSKRLQLRKPDLKRAMLGMPPLLRSYLLLGGWVSDHAVVDRDMNTLHVFTGLEIRTIPASRKRLLRATAS